MTGNPMILIVVAALMMELLGLVSLLAHIDNLNNIKSKTVGDGRHGTARWANKSEVRKIYRHIPFTPVKWREQAAKGKEPTTPDGKPLPQGIVADCTGGKNTTALVDTGDVCRNYGTIAKQYGYQVSTYIRRTLICWRIKQRQKSMPKSSPKPSSFPAWTPPPSARTHTSTM